MPTSNLEVLRKPVNTDMVIAAHANARRHYAILVFTYEISQVSKLQDKHNTSFRIIYERIIPTLLQKYKLNRKNASFFYNFAKKNEFFGGNL